jgi:hypothetical protein
MRMLWLLCYLLLALLLLLLSIWNPWYHRHHGYHWCCRYHCWNHAMRLLVTSQDQRCRWDQ